MNNTIEFSTSVSDIENIEQEEIENYGVDIVIYSEISDLLVSNYNNEKHDGTVFGLSLIFGKERNKRVMLDVYMNELELFASSLLKNIEIIRREYSNEIRKQTIFGKEV